MSGRRHQKRNIDHNSEHGRQNHTPSLPLRRIKYPGKISLDKSPVGTRPVLRLNTSLHSLSYKHGLARSPHAASKNSQSVSGRAIRAISTTETNVTRQSTGEANRFLLQSSCRYRGAIPVPVAEAEYADADKRHVSPYPSALHQSCPVIEPLHKR